MASREIKFRAWDKENKLNIRKPGVVEIMKTTVVHCLRESYDVYIGRPSKWGNPFVIGKDGTRKEVIEKYRKWVLLQPDLLEKLSELKGKRLGCYCKPKKCHGDILVEMIDAVLEFPDRYEITI
jgi:hypothetical protein